MGRLVAGRVLGGLEDGNTGAISFERNDFPRIIAASQLIRDFSPRSLLEAVFGVQIGQMSDD